MVKIKSMEESCKNYAKNSLESYLRGEKNLNWIVGVIRESGILQYKGELQKMFNNLQYINKENPRYKEILEECKKQKWL